MLKPPAVAIVCAKNEAPRIERVLRVLTASVRTLVVDDGSTDDTSAVATRCGAEVLRLPQNLGKGQAMLAGIRKSVEPVVVFIDADLTGLRADHIERLVAPILRGDYGMVIGLQDRGPLINTVSHKLPLISGQRAVRRDILGRMPVSVFDGYGVETAMNHACAALNHRMGTTVLDGLFFDLKWEKEGDIGVAKMVDMAAEVTRKNLVLARPEPAYREPPTPPSLAARGMSSEEVMRGLARSLVDAGGPLIREHVLDDRTKTLAFDTIGRRIAAPMWTLACAACAFFFGPVVGITASIAALVHHHRKYGH